MSENNICPGCGKHCDLSEPHCGRGEEYNRTGIMPEQKWKSRRDEMRMEHYLAADMNSRLITNLRDLGHIMRMLYEGKASQRRILIILNETEKITQRDLTDRLGIQPGSASEILSKLESAGWILRTQNEGDRRTTDICLTDSGRELAEEASEQRKERHEEMFSCLSEEEKQQLLSLLERIRTDWRTRYEGREKAHGHGSHERHGGCDGHGKHAGHSHKQGQGRRYRHHEGLQGHEGN